MHSVANIVVKKEPRETWDPCSPTLWGDYISLKDAHATHQAYVHGRNVYTPLIVALSNFG